MLLVKKQVDWVKLKDISEDLLPKRQGYVSHIANSSIPDATAAYIPQRISFARNSELSSDRNDLHVLIIRSASGQINYKNPAVPFLYTN